MSWPYPIPPRPEPYDPWSIDTGALHSLRSALVSRTDRIMDYEETFAVPFMEAVHNDRSGLEGFLNSISVEELDDISEVFYAIYLKWTDQKMHDFLESLEKKIEKYYKAQLGLKS